MVKSRASRIACTLVRVHLPCTPVIKRCTKNRAPKLFVHSYNLSTEKCKQYYTKNKTNKEI